MATELGQAYVQIMPSAKGISGSIQKAINPEATAAGKSAGSRIASSISKSLGSAGKTLTKAITLPVAGATTAIAGLVGALGFKRLVGLDTAQAKLKGLGYDAKEVERISGQVENAIAGGMTTMGEGVSIAAGGLAAGVKEGAELERYIKLVGDAAVGANRPVDEMAQIFNRVQGGGRLMTQELNMIEMGLPGFAQAMANELAGGSLETFREMVTNGEVGSKEFLNVMDDFAGGMADAYSESWEGMAKNTLAYVGIIGESLLEGLFEDGKKGLANLIEVLQSDELMDWAQQTGEKIRDVASKIVEVAQKVIEWWTNLSSGGKKITGIFAAIAVAIGPILLVVSKVISTFLTLMPLFKLLGAAIAAITSPIGLVVAALIGAVALIIAYWEPIREFFINLWEGIKETGLLIWESMKIAWENTVQWLKDAWASVGEFFINLWESIKEAVSMIWESLKEVWQTTKEGLIQTWESVTEFFSNLWETVKTIFSTAWTAIKTSVTTVINGLKSTITAVFNGIKSFISSTLNVIQTVFSTVWNGIKLVITTVMNVIRNIITSVWNGIRSVISSVLNVIMSVVTSVMNGIRSIISSVWNGIKSTITSVVNGIRSTISNIFNSLRGIVSSAFNGVRSAVSNGMTSAFNAVKNFFGRFKDAGKKIVTSIADGIKGAIGKVTGAIGDVAQKVRDFLPFSPPKIGPLTDIMDVKWGETISGGIEKGENVVQKAMHDLLTFDAPHKTAKHADVSDSNQDVTVLLKELINAVRENRDVFIDGEKVTDRINEIDAINATIGGYMG